MSLTTYVKGKKYENFIPDQVLNLLISEDKSRLQQELSKVKLVTPSVASFFKPVTPVSSADNANFPTGDE